MKHILVTVLLFALVACTSRGVQTCGQVASYQVPDTQSDLYPVMILDIDGVPVAPQPVYNLSAGMHKIKVAAMIHAPELEVALKNRTPKARDFLFELGYRYHVAAKLKKPLSVPVLDSNYWQVVIWKKQEVSCEQQGNNNKTSS